MSTPAHVPAQRGPSEREHRLGADGLRRAREVAEPAPEFTEGQKAQLALLLARIEPTGNPGAA